MIKKSFLILAMIIGLLGIGLGLFTMFSSLTEIFLM